MEMNISDLLDNYLTWYKQKFTIKELKKIHEIETPFVNHINDRISIFVEVDKNRIILSDDGVTLDELEMHGVDLTVKSRKLELDNILRNFSLTIKDDVIISIVNGIKDFNQSTHNFIQGLLQVYDIMFTTRDKVANIFKEEVFSFFYENEFGGNEEVDLKGASGLKHYIDYSIGGKPNKPEIYIKIIQKPDFNYVAAQQFVSDDLKKVRNHRSSPVKFVIIADDSQHTISDRVKKTADEINIDLLEWTNKKSILELKN